MEDEMRAGFAATLIRVSEVARLALTTHGKEKQIAQLHEELHELGVVASHFRRGRITDGAIVFNEIADVFIMAAQLALMVDPDPAKKLVNAILAKCDRSEARLIGDVAGVDPGIGVGISIVTVAGQSIVQRSGADVLNDQEAFTALDGNAILAISMYRKRTGAGVAVARDRVEGFISLAMGLGMMKRGPMPPMEADHDKEIGFDKAPTRYEGQGREVIDLIRDELGDDGFSAFCRGNAMKYEQRAGKKGDAQTDRQKADWYRKMADHLISPEKYPDPRADRPGFIPYKRPGA